MYQQILLFGIDFHDLTKINILFILCSFFLLSSMLK